MRLFAARVTAMTRPPFQGWRVQCYFRRFSEAEQDPCGETLGFGVFAGPKPCTLLTALDGDRVKVQRWVDEVNGGRIAGVRAGLVEFELTEV